MQIVVRQLSGLGNQIFQYAAGLYYARKYQAALRVASDPVADRPSHGYPRPFQLNQFRIPAPMNKSTLLDELQCTLNPRAETASSMVRGFLNSQLFVEPEQYRFYPELPYLRFPATVYLRAYWQAAGYAEAVATELRPQLALRQDPRGKDAEVLSLIASSPCPVSVHVRRGDYLVGKQTMALPLSYYRMAWRKMLAELEGAEFFVFSDDIVFAREHLPGEGKRHFVAHNKASTAYQDLRLMAACRHHIIANSSFSWWGAWMNPNPEKVVIAPKYWWNNTESFYPDLFPSRWRLLDNLAAGVCER